MMAWSPPRHRLIPPWSAAIIEDKAPVTLQLVGTSRKGRIRRSRTATSTTRSTPTRRRRLEDADDPSAAICPDSQSNSSSFPLFWEEVLGPTALQVDSLFQNVLVNDLDLTQLALELLYPYYVNAGSTGSTVSKLPFVQSEQYFGHNGEYTEEILAQHSLLMEFWKTNEQDRPPILLLGLHSEPLAEPENLEAAIYEHLVYTLERFDTTDEQVTEIASNVRNAVETELPGGFANSVLSLDAAFVPVFGVVEYEDSPIIYVGDGYLDFDEWLGLGAIGNDITHAHEFGHALQFFMELEDFNGDLNRYVEYTNEAYSNPEGSRQIELEADAMAGYALAHQQGRNLDLDSLLQTSRESFASGDCDVDLPGHHGTPLQRECATRWGADEGLDMTGDPVSMRAFRELFLASYNRILNLDPEVCTLSEPTNVPIDGTDNIISPTMTPIAGAPIALNTTPVPTSSATPSLVSSSTPSPSPSPSPTIIQSPIAIPTPQINRPPAVPPTQNTATKKPIQSLPLPPTSVPALLSTSSGACKWQATTSTSLTTIAVVGILAVI